MKPSTEGLEGDCPGGSDQAGKASSCTGCPGQTLCASEAASLSTVDEALCLRMGAIRKKVLVLSGKGGVGKSSVAVQMASRLARQGFRTGLLDVDLCGPSVAQMLGVGGSSVVQTPYGWQPVKPDGHEGRLSVMSVALLLGSRDAPVIWRGPRKDAMIHSMLKETFWSKLDILIIDTPPGSSDEHLSVLNALRSQVDGAILVTTPQQVSLTMVKRELTFCRKLGVPVLGLVENMAGYQCPCCQEIWDLLGSGGQATRELAEFLKLDLMGRIPVDERMGAAGESGIPLIVDGGGPASDAIEKICTSLADKVELNND